MYNPIYGHFCPTPLFCPCYTVVQFLFSLWRLMVTLFFNILTQNKKIWKIWLLVLSMIFTWPLSRHSSLRDIFLEKKHPNVQKGPFYPFFYEHVHKRMRGFGCFIYIARALIIKSNNAFYRRVRPHKDAFFCFSKGTCAYGVS